VLTRAGSAAAVQAELAHVPGIATVARAAASDSNRAGTTVLLHIYLDNNLLAPSTIRIKRQKPTIERAVSGSLRDRRRTRNHQRAALAAPFGSMRQRAWNTRGCMDIP
jgi:hypothetical protein